MTRAYEEIYLNDAQSTLALAFDYAVNDCGVYIDLFAQLFASSTEGILFAQGDPRLTSGMSGIELALTQLERLQYLYNSAAPSYGVGKTPEYWAGWVLAYYQWHSNSQFKTILRAISASELVEMYPLYHETGMHTIIGEIDRRMLKGEPEPTNLGTIRKSRGVSQTELAELSGVNVRSIQMYEQRVNDIDKAQAITLYRMASVLGCQVEDLLEGV